MYNTHAMIISEHALKTQKGLLDVITFTFSTIQQALSTSPMQLDDIALNGLESKYLFGSKKAGLKYAQENIGQLFWDVQELKKKSLTNVDTITEAVRLFYEIPGLNTVKASFICQMLGFDVACLDSHNLNRLGMAQKDVTIPKSLKNEKLRMKKIKAYVALTQKQGTVYWWNSWCDYVAEKGGANKLLPTGEDVSAFHVGCVVR